MNKRILVAILMLLMSTHASAGYKELRSDYDTFDLPLPSRSQQGIKEFGRDSWGNESAKELVDGLKAESIKALDDQSMAPKFEENLLKRSEAESFLAKGGTVDELRALVASRNRSVRSQRERALAAIESISQVALLD